MKKITFNKFNSFYLNNTESIEQISHEILSSGQYIRGDIAIKFEKKLAEVCNRKYAITTSSCTDALFLSLKAAGIKQGDEVILPAFSYIASLSPILMCEATPVFADINASSLMLDIDKIERLITSKTKAIIFVQLFGTCKNINELHDLAKLKQIKLIEDAAQALGANTSNHPGGSFGDYSCISFDPTKIISAYGTGGAILTNDKSSYDKLKKFVHHGRNNEGEFETLGYNSKIPSLNIGLLSLQLDKLDEIITANQIIAKAYTKYLSEVAQVKLIQLEENTISTYHKFVILAQDRDALKEHLLKNNIETRIHYKPLLHEQKLMSTENIDKPNLRISEEMQNKVLSLPIYPDLDSLEIAYICDTIKSFYKRVLK